jgi:tripartite-type tricarboxylate transporter receptor subunit TctC
MVLRIRQANPGDQVAGKWGFVDGEAHGVNRVHPWLFQGGFAGACDVRHSFPRPEEAGAGREEAMQAGMRRSLAGALLCVGVTAALAVEAQGADVWPSRPVKVVVPFSAAGTADLLARVVADKLSASLGQPFVLEHRPGAGGIIGQEQVARAAPDGYTFVISSIGSFVISPVINPVPFDPFRDFTHIAYLGGQPVALYAPPNARYRTLAELVTEAKAKPGALGFATISVGSQTQLVHEQFQRKTGIKMTHVPYRGAGQIVTDVLGGHIAVGITALTAAAGPLAAGTLRGLAVSSEARLPDFPDLPTYKEQGYPELVASAWFALSGPANLPREIVDRVNAEVIKAVHSPELQPRFRKEAIDLKTLDADGFTAFFKSEADRWTPLARDIAAQIKDKQGQAPQ